MTRTKSHRRPLERGTLQRVLLGALKQNPKGLPFAALSKIGVDNGSTSKSVSVALPRMRKRGLVKRDGDAYVLAAPIVQEKIDGADQRKLREFKDMAAGIEAAPTPRGKHKVGRAAAKPATKDVRADSVRASLLINKPARWMPGQLQEAIYAELKKAPHTRADLYAKLKTTGRTSIVAALNSFTGVERGADGVYRLRSSAPAAGAEAVTRSVDPIVALRDVEAASKVIASAHVAERLSPLAKLLRDVEPATLAQDLQLAVSFADVYGRISQLPEDRRLHILAIAATLI